MTDILQLPGWEATGTRTELAMSIIDNEGAAVWSWQGIRAEESPHRAREPEFEEVGGGAVHQSAYQALEGV